MMNRFFPTTRRRRPGAELLVCLLLLFAANPCAAMIHISVADYGANGTDGKNDSAAFQAALNALFASNPKGGYLYIPNGTYDFNSRVSVYADSAWDLTIQGQSRTGVVLRCNNTSGVLQVTNTGRFEHIILRDLTLKANIANAGTAYEGSAPLGGTPPGRMEQIFNVDVTNAPNCYFNNGLNLYAAQRALVDGCTISSPVTDADMSDTSINFRMKKAINLDGSYNAVVRNTVINGADTAVSMAMPLDQSTEGGTCMNVHANYVKTGFVFSIGTTTRAGLEIRDNDITARDIGIRLVNRDIYFLAENTFRQLSPTNALKDIDLQGCPYGTVVRNTFAGPLAGGRTNVSLAPSASYTYVDGTNSVTHSDICHDIIIGQNTLSGAASNAVAADASSYDIIITGNNDITGPAFTTNSFAKADGAVSHVYSGSLTNTASDADGDVLTFCKAGGPAWLTVNFDGTLSGIPSANDVGTNVFTLRVMDNGGLRGADATMTIVVASQTPPVWPGSMTLESIGAEDGVVTESAQGSGVGGATQTTTTGSGGLRLGDTAANTQFRSFVSFDTALLPSDCTVTNATLKLKRATVVGTNPFTWSGAVAYADIKGGSGFSGSTALQSGDFEAVADATAVAVMSVPVNNSDWSVGALNQSSLQYVDRAGRTQLRVRLTPATDTNATVDYMGFFPGDATTQTNRPVFEVGYLRPDHAPVWNANPLAKPNATEAIAYSGSLAADATDPDVGDTLTFAKVSGSPWLTVATNGVLAGTPGNGDVGTNSFIVRVTDSYGAADDATINIFVINVNNAPTWNANPLAKPDATEGVAYSDSLVADAADVDMGDTLIFSKTSGPSWLAVAANGALAGTPQHANAGANVFTVRVTDAAGLWAEATMDISVIGLATSTPPVANDQIVVLPENTATNLVLTATSGNGTNLTYFIGNIPANGSLSGLNPNTGAVIYTPGSNFFGGDSFTFAAFDGSLYATGTVSITVTFVNQPPVADNQGAMVTEDTAANLLLTASDVDSTNLVYSILTSPAHGSLSGLNTNSGGVTYLPETNYFGGDSFTFAASDGALYSTGTVSLAVAAVNDAPVANSQGVIIRKMTSANLYLTATDVDNPSLTYSILTGPAHGILVGLNPASGTATYTPDANYLGADSFVFTVGDGSLAATGTVSLTILGLPAPWLTQDIGSGYAAGNASESNGVFTVAGCGNINSTADNFRFVYRPFAGDGEMRARIPSFQGGSTAQYGVMLRDNLTSPAKMIYMGVSGSGNLASKSRVSSGANAGNIASSTGTAPDVWVRLVRVGDSVTAYQSANGTGWTPVSTNTVALATNCFAGLGVGFNSTTTLKTGTFDNVTVADANLAPVANSQSLTVAGDTSTNLLLTASDPDSPSLMYAILTDPAHGNLSGLYPNTGAVTYTPGTYYHGTDSFTFTVSNGSLDATGTVSLVVMASVTTNTGTPLWWLAQYGQTNFNADALADVDGDGLLTWQEYIAGTNPTNAASSFWIASAGATVQGHAILRWPSVANRFYDLARTTNLLLPFAILPGATNLPATPPQNSYTNPEPASPAAFYRVNVHQ